MSHWMTARFDGRCNCGAAIEEDDRIYFNGRAWCEACGKEQEMEDRRRSGETSEGKRPS